MGGQACLIWGHMAEEAIKPLPAKRSWLDKILGRQRFREKEVMELPNGTRLIEVPVGDLELLGEDFAQFLARRISQPWAATQAFLDYLSMDVVSIQVRGEHDPETPGPDWYVQITFSGCAGLAEVSAELGGHWAETWFREECDRISQRFLLPFGFVPGDIRPMPGTNPRFLPLGQAGYALYVGEGDADPEWEGPKRFELDASATEALALDGHLSSLQILDERFGPLMADGKCRCQLCMPDFHSDELEIELA